VRRVLVYGYGNPGRLDDGLGPAVIEALDGAIPPGVTLDSNYQLSVEDAALVAEHEVVVFVDADATGPAPFWFDALEPTDDVSFSSHSLSPGAVLGLSRGALGGTAAGYVLGVRGYEFDEFAERLSEGARRNLDAALAFLRRALAEQRFAEYVTEHRRETARP
jgi:hydrogenase maturation protease